MSGQGNSSSVYNQLRLQGILCDAVLKAEDVEFPVHKIILCFSPYFRALFTRWQTPDCTVSTIPGVSADMLQQIIQFAYTGSVSVTEDNVQELMMAANQFKVTDMVQICSSFISERLSPENCIGVWKLTHICLSPELQLKAYRYIIDHFDEIVPCEEFLQLTGEELLEMIGRDDLNVRKESTVYEAIIRWITHMPEERERHLPALYSKVRLALMNLNSIVHMFSNKMLETSFECFRLTCRMFIKDVRVQSYHNLQVRPRLPNAVLLAIGGWSNGGPSNVMEAYDFKADRWLNVTNNIERPHAYHGTAFLGGYVYCIGGYERVEYFNSVRRFDPTNNTWQEVAPMNYCRCYVSVTVLNGFIYAIGGFNGHLRLSSAERYNPETNQWTLIQHMKEERGDASCTTLNGRIYICGGFNGNECLKTAEYYSPETDQWTLITPMNSRRSGLGVIAYADQVFAVGGFNGRARLQTVEAYNPQTDSWHYVGQMLSPRSNFGIEVIDDHLFAIGGFNGSSTSYKTEYYDAVTDQWTPACRMEVCRHALSCCVVYGFPNLSDYVYPRDDLLHLDSKSDA